MAGAVISRFVNPSLAIFHSLPISATVRISLRVHQYGTFSRKSRPSDQSGLVFMRETLALWLVGAIVAAFLIVSRGFCYLARFGYSEVIRLHETQPVGLCSFT